MNAAGLRDGDRACAHMPRKQPSQMPRSNAQTLGQFLYAAVIQRPLADQPKGARNAGCGPLPRWAVRRRPWTAAQARPEAGLLRGGRGQEVTYVRAFRRPSGTDRAAIDSRRGYACEK